MKKKSFTLIEILVALIVLSILASLSVAVYQKTVDANNERICAENLKVLQAAIDIYTVENDLLPAGLAQLTPRYIYLASSRVIGERKENTLNIALRKMFSTEQALALNPPSPTQDGEIFKRKYIAGNIKVFRDPADKNYQEPAAGCSGSCGSYTFVFNSTTIITDPVTGKQSLNKALSVNAALIQDTAGPTPRHGHETYNIGITPAGRVGKITGGNVYPTGS